MNLQTNSQQTTSDASASLLQRPLPDDYRAQQTTQLTIPQHRSEASGAFSALIFRLAQEWFALPAGLCHQVLLPVTAHTLPHRSNATLLGVVNVRGQMLLKVSLSNLLGLSASQTNNAHIYPRMVVIEKTTQTGESDRWVFDVDELDGIHTVARNQIEPPAAGVKSAIACTQNLFVWQEKRVNLLDDHRLFEALRQQAL